MKPLPTLLYFGLLIMGIGIVMIAFPGIFYMILELPNSAATTLFMRFFGVLLFLEGFFFVGARHTADVRVIKTFYIGSIIADTAMGLLSLEAASSHTVNFIGYFFAFLFFLFVTIYIIALIPLHRATRV